MGTIELAGITKRFGDVTAVGDIDLTIEDGEYLVLVGPSGSGKTTLLRTVAGLEAPTEGTVTIADQDVTDVPARERDTALVFQDFALFPHMNARENLGFNLRVRGETDDIDVRVTETAELLGIENLLDRELDELSGGQKQRVALGRAIACEPTVFLLDEPFANLDAPLRDHMRTELGRLQRRLGITTVHVTHDQREAMAVADRIAILDGGTLHQVGTPREVYARPANQFVARFVGDPRMNLFDAQYDPTQQSIRVPDASLSWACELDAPDPPTSVTVGIRPEHVTLTGDSDAGTRPAAVDYLEFFGAEAVAYLDVPSLPELVARIPVPNGFETDDSVGVSIDSEQLHVFGPTGERLPIVDEEDYHYSE